MADRLIDQLGLKPQPEGGHYRQTWRSSETVNLPDGRERALATLILFDMQAGESSAWHVVKSDEIWMAQIGTFVLELGGNGAEPGDATQYRLGTNVDAGELLQVLVPGGTWQRTVPTDAETLVSCMVSPGFEFEDFALFEDAKHENSALVGE